MGCPYKNSEYPYQNTLYSLSMKLYNYLWNNRHRFRRNIMVNDGKYKISARVIAAEMGLDHYKTWGTVLGNAFKHLEELGLIEIVEKRVRSGSKHRVVYVFKFKAGGDNPKIEDLK